MKKAFKKGFTLAEIMIVLTIIGVLTAILLPIANHSRPDENVMKFKKADTTFKNVIRELVNSDKYKDGMLSYRADGRQIYGGFKYWESGSVGTENDVKYFCETFADVISTKSVNCSTVKTAENDGQITFVAIPLSKPQSNTHYRLQLEEAKKKLDSACSSTAKTVGAEIVSTDNISYYQTNPSATFGISWGCGNGRLFECWDEDGFIETYKVFCIDIDGIDKGEAPFGYGIRVDGKIVSGARADEWMEKGFQKGSNEN